MFGSSKKKRGRPPKAAEAPDQGQAGDPSQPGAAIVAQRAAALPAIQVSGEDIQTLRATIAHDLNDSEFKLFLFECARRGTHPMSRLIHPVKRQGKVTFQSSIDYLRARAESSGKYDGQDAPVYEGTLGRPDFRATVTVYRKGLSRGIAATAFFDEYRPGEGQDFMWKKMPHVMIGKCAEALALRKGFPEELQGLYTHDEMGGAGDPGAAIPAEPSKPALKEPQARKKAEPVEGGVTTPTTKPNETGVNDNKGTPEPETPKDTPKEPESKARAENSGSGPIPTASGRKITAPMAKRLFAILKSESVKSTDDMKEWMQNTLGVSRSEDIDSAWYATAERWLLNHTDEDYTKLMVEVSGLIKQGNLMEFDVVGHATSDKKFKVANCDWQELINTRKLIRDSQKK